MNRLTWALVAVYAVAMAFGLFGILVAIPHPELWAHDPRASAIYAFALAKTGGAGMCLGALAMFVAGCAALGLRRTALFFIAATTLSAAAELTGTATGWPFGGYAYSDFLGAKLLGRVPFPIPLSWFTMGLAAYVLAAAIVTLREPRVRALATVALAAWLLTAWDLVLDPSMAAPQLQYVHFWTWHEHGPYFGMPLRNLAGWFATGLAFIAAGRALWREAEPPAAPPGAAFAIYATGVVWSAILAVAAGLWPTALLGVLLALLPATLALRAERRVTALA